MVGKYESGFYGVEMTAKPTEEYLEKARSLLNSFEAIGSQIIDKSKADLIAEALAAERRRTLELPEIKELHTALKLIIETQCPDHPICTGNEKVGKTALENFNKLHESFKSLK